MPGRAHLNAARLRRPRSRRAWGFCVLALVLVVGAVVVVWWVRRPVEIRSYDLSAADRAACQAFVDDLPDSLADQDRVDVRPDGALGAAYGDPAIIVTCGVPVPDGFDQTSRCDEVNGIGWYIPDGSDNDRSVDLRLAAAGFRPVVEVVVPADLRPAARNLGDDTTAAVLATLAPIVGKHLRQEQRCDG